MPDHIHGIVLIDKPFPVQTQNFASQRDTTYNPQSIEYKNTFGPQSQNLPSIIRGYKAALKKWATIENYDFAWQPLFYDRIIRDENELNNVREYIKNNPINWKN